MPELPEVETMRRGVLPIVGSTIRAVEKPPCSCRPILMEPRIDRFNRRAKGARIEDVKRLGKRIVVELNNACSIVIEPRMSGLVLLADPPTEQHLRLRLVLSGDPDRLLFWDRRGLGTVRLLTLSQLEQLKKSRLGPDALDITVDQLYERLRKTRRPGKVALLDQGLVAGIGNLYAAEILHVAGVDPRVGSDQLTRKQVERIHEAVGLVLREAIRCEGSTLSDGTYRNALNSPGDYQNHHRVYDRAGEKCGRCGEGTIQRIVQAQRSTFYCPNCQRRRSVHPSVNQSAR